MKKFNRAQLQADLQAAIQRFFARVLILLRTLLGDFHYTKPPWLEPSLKRFAVSKAGRWLGAKLNWARQNKRAARARGAGFVVLMVAIYLGAQGVLSYYRSLPQPDYVDIEVQGPREPDLETYKASVLRVRFSKSVVPLDALSRPVKEGVTLSPQVEGSWRWENDRTLVFTPLAQALPQAVQKAGGDAALKSHSAQWLVDTQYTVSFKQKLFTDQSLFHELKKTFQTPNIAGSFTKSEFYQDPKDPRIKRAIFNVNFNYAFDAEDFKKRVHLTLQSKNDSMLGAHAKSFPFSVSIGQFGSQGYIISDPIEIPKDDQILSIVIDSGVRTVRGGATPAEMKSSVEVPGMLNYFKFENSEMTFVRNDRYEPEQVLILQTKAVASSENVAKVMQVFLLPLKNPDLAKNIKPGQKPERRHRWQSISEITESVKKEMTPVSTVMIPTEQESSVMHSFKLQVPPHRALFVRIPKGLKSYGGYELAKDFETVVSVPDFPRDLVIMSQGSLLSLSGDKKISVLGRNMHKVEFHLSRILPAQLNQLIVNVYGTSGDFSHPNFASFSDDTLSEKFTEKRTLKVESEAAAQYLSFDLQPYLSSPAKGEPNRRGLFYVNVADTESGIKDDRLVLLTDLGVVVKETVAKSHEVFVQNLRSGAPVSGATVEVVGANGIAVAEAKTDEEGHASFQDLSEFKNEKRPIAFVVKKESDLSYLPYHMQSRELNFSQFDIGGIYESAKSDQLTAFLFSDRGLYRPGDKVNLGLLVRGKNWQKNFDNVPVVWSVTDARGTEVHRETINVSAKEMKALSFSTQDYSSTGTYEIHVFVTKKNEADQLIGSLNVRIEEFLPDRMRISTHLSEERVDGWVHPKGLAANVKLQNLFGTAAENRKITATINLIPTSPHFRGLADYIFSDVNHEEKNFSETLEQKTTDATGSADYDLHLERFDSGIYSLRFEAEGFEAAGGRGVTASSAVLVSPLNYLVGTKRDSDLRYLRKSAPHEVEVIAVSPDLKKIAVQDLKVSVIERRYVSSLLKQPDGTYKYLSVLKEVPKSTQDFAIGEKGIKYALATETAGDFTLVFKNKSGLELGKLQYTVVGDGNLARTLDKNAELQLSLNKKDYAPGEEIEMQIKAPYTGAGLITIERDKIYAVKWFKTSTTGTLEKIKIPAGVEGSAYVNVTFLRAIDSKEIFMSPLSYAVQPFSVNLDAHKTEITLKVADRVRPGDKLKISYKTSRPSKLVLYGVDEGILLVGHYKMPDPLTFFFQRRALQVKTFQILDLLLPEYSVLQSLSSAGGDADGAVGRNLNPFKRKTDKPIVFWSGVIDAGPVAQDFIYEVPEYFNGSIKVMAVAATQGAFGTAEKPVLVRGDFIITPNVPTFVAPADQFEVGVGISNQAEGSGPKADIKLEMSPDPGLEILGGQAQNVIVAEGHESSVTFKLKAKEKLGSSRVQVSASLGKKIARSSVELSIRPANPYMHDLLAGMLDAGHAEVVVDRDLIPEFRVQQAGLSPAPILIAKGLEGFLDSNPYGCTEQLISKAMPFVVLKSRSEFKIDAKKASEMFTSTLAMLRTRQTSEGGFSLYARQGGSHSAASLYTVHFLLEAKERGFAVPEDMLSKAVSYLQIESLRQVGSLMQARLFSYALYLQARSGRVPSQDLSFLRKVLEKNFKTTWQSDLTAAFMAATYSLLKQEDEGKALFRKLTLAPGLAVAEYEYFYDSLSRDMDIVYIAAKYFPETLSSIVTDKNLARAFAPLMTGQYNTYSAAHGILALDALVANGGKAENISALKISQTLAGAAPQDLILPPQTTMPLVNFANLAKKLSFQGPTQTPGFYFMLESGFDRELPKKEIKQKLEITREYLDAGGNVVTHIPIGQELTVRLRVRSLLPSGLNNVAIVDLLPGGFEPVLEASAASENTPQGGDGNANGDQDGSSMPQQFDEGDAGEIDEPTRGGGADSHSDDGAHNDRAGPTTKPEVKQTKFVVLNQWLHLWQESARAQAAFGSQASGPSVVRLSTAYVDRREDRLVIYAGHIAAEVAEFTYKIKAINQGDFIVPPVFGESLYDRSVKYRGLAGKIVVGPAQTK